MTSQWEIRHYYVNVYRCIEGVKSNCLSLHTMAVKESNVNIQYFLWSDLHLFVLILWLASFISIWNFYAKIVFLLYCDLDTTPDLLVYILTNVSGEVLIVCKHCECSGSSGIVSKTNFWILILHIFIHLKSQGCRFLTVYLWCDSHWNVGNPQMR